jgi:hypothetical protein
VVLPAFGCEMIAKVSRRAISLVRVLVNPLQQLPEGAATRKRSGAPALAVDMMALRWLANC